MKNLIVGSAAWRSSYGISNSNLNLNDLKELFQFLEKNNILTIDTASSYGDAEDVIYKYSDKFKIHTKIKPFKQKREFIEELSKVNNAAVKVVYFHDEKILKRFSSLQIFDFVQEIRERGFYPGFSLYEKEEFVMAVNQYSDKAYYQVPLNIFDLVSAKGLSKKIEKRTIFRSLFLRGFIFLNESEIKFYLGNEYNEIKIRFEEFYEMKFEKDSFQKLTYSLIRYIDEKDLKFTIGLNSIKEIKEFIKNVGDAKIKRLDWEEKIRKSNTILPITQITI